MPQPLSKVCPDASYEIGNVGTRSLLMRPELGLKAMEVIATWSHVESFMLSTYVELAGGDNADAAAVYLAMETSSAKSAAINTLAELKLTQDNLVLLKAIIKILKSSEKHRNKLAHWIWGTSDQIPDGLLLADPRDRRFSPENIYVYKAVDFDGYRTLFSRIAGWGMLFRFILMDHVANRNGELYHQLCAEPEISEVLNHRT